MATESEIVEHRLQIGQDLGLPGIGASPGPVGRKGKRVQMTLDVAGGARIGIASPSTSDAVVALDDHQIVNAGAAQRNRSTQAAEPRTDDRHLRWAPPPGRGPDPTDRITATADHRPPSARRISKPCRSPRARHASRMSAYSVGPPKKKLPCRVLASALPSRL